MPTNPYILYNPIFVAAINLSMVQDLGLEELHMLPSGICWTLHAEFGQQSMTGRLRPRVRLTGTCVSRQGKRMSESEKECRMDMPVLHCAHTVSAASSTSAAYSKPCSAFRSRVDMSVFSLCLLPPHTCSHVCWVARAGTPLSKPC